MGRSSASPRSRPAAPGTCRSSASPGRRSTAGRGCRGPQLQPARRHRQPERLALPGHHLRPRAAGRNREVLRRRHAGPHLGDRHLPAVGVADTWSTNIPGTKPTGVTNSFLNGKVDDVRAYNRRLSAAELSILYNARQTCSVVGLRRLRAAASRSAPAICTDKTIDSGNCGACGTTCNTGRRRELHLAAAAAAPAAPTAAPSASTPPPTRPTAAAAATPCGAVTCASCSSGMVGLWHLDEGSGATSAGFVGQRPHADAQGTPRLGHRRVGRRAQLQRHQLPDGHARDLVRRQQHAVGQRLGLRDLHHQRANLRRHPDRRRRRTGTCRS